MRRMPTLNPLHVRTCLAAIALTACGSSSDFRCIALPCPVTFAAKISVTSSSTAKPLSNVTWTANTATGDCAAGSPIVCSVSGSPGTLQIDIKAPGFQTAHRTIEVQGTSAGCNTCGSVATQTLSVALDPVP